MLTRLTLCNFQVHKHLVVDLDPHVTMFVGDSDVGKSTVLRALRWLCLNRPDGDEMITWDKDFTKVTLEVDGHRIIRKRGKRNLYSLDGKKFTAFGRNVPDEIAQVLNVTDLNFQFQHDPLFWLSLTAGQVSRELNHIVNLGAIDTTLTEVASKLRKAKAAVEVSEGRLEGALRRKKELAWVPDMDRALRRLEDLDGRVLRVASQGRNLYDLCEGLAECRIGLKNRRKAAVVGSQCVSLGNRVQAIKRKSRDLRQLVQATTSAKATLAVARDDYKRAKQTFNRDAKGKLCPNCERPF